VGIGMFVEPMYVQSGEVEEGIQREQVGLLVKKLVEGGPAALSGLIQVGDMLYKVNNEVVANIKLKELATHLLGQSGSEVVLTMKRNDAPDYTVAIKRGAVTSPPPLLSNSNFDWGLG